MRPSLPQPDRAGLLASARDTHAARENMAAGASFFAFLSHVAWSWRKGRISHGTNGGPGARDGRSIFPRLEGTNRGGRTVGGVRTGTVAS